MTDRLTSSLVGAVFAAVAVTSALAGQGAAEPEVELLEAGTCADCTISLEPLMRYGDPGDIEPMPHGVPLLLPDGRLLLGRSSGPILWYDQLGRLGGTLGTTGDKPGQYQGVRALIAGPGDSVTLVGPGSGVGAVISTATGDGRSQPLTLLTMPHALVRLADGTLVLSTNYPRTPAFVALTPALERRGAFGPGADVPEPNIHVLAPSRLGGFWAARQAYSRRIQRWSGDGELLRRFDAMPSWFTPYSQKEEAERMYGRDDGVPREPLDRIVGVQEDAEGRLWVLGHTADPAWRTNPEHRVDTIIEVFDAASGALLGAWRSHRFLSGFVADGVAYGVEWDNNRAISIQAWKLVLQH